jgi:23S rRNA (guanosine2251-2'-O)-methyltransferase
MNETLSHSVLRQCRNPECKFRFPDTNFLETKIPCPICNTSTDLIQRIDLSIDERIKNSWQIPIEFASVLDNIRSVYNVGAIFRTALGFGLRKIYLCGITPTPNHKNFNKTSLGAERYVYWEKSLNCVEQCKVLQNDGYKIISIETSDNAISILNVNKKTITWNKIAVVVGNEISGVDPQVIALSNLVISIPINGANKSFNVTTAFGIAVYHLANIIST